MPSPSLAASRPRHPIRLRLVRARRVNPDDSDIKLFVLSFGAFFVCIYTLIF